MMPELVVATLWHSFSGLVFSATLVYNVSSIYIPNVTDSYGGRFKFLTFWHLVVASVYNLGAFILHVYLLISGTEKNSSPAQPSSASVSRNSRKQSGNDNGLLSFRNGMFASVVFPLAFLVTALFWTIFAIKSELMLPVHVRKVIPVNGFYNHAAHSCPFPFALMESILVRHKYPSRKSGIAVFCFFASAYILWVLWIAYYANIWVYGVLRVLPWYGLVGLFALSFVLGAVIYSVGEQITKQVWEKEDKPKLK